MECEIGACDLLPHHPGLVYTCSKEPSCHSSHSHQSNGFQLSCSRPLTPGGSTRKQLITSDQYQTLLRPKHDIFLPHCLILAGLRSTKTVLLYLVRRLLDLESSYSVKTSVTRVTWGQPVYWTTYCDKEHNIQFFFHCIVNKYTTVSVTTHIL